MTIRLTGLALFVGLGCALAYGGAAIAQSPDDGRGRFSMSPVDGGFLRLDKETGAVAMCARKGTVWACDPVEDNASKRSADTATLEQENKDLKQRVKELEDSLAAGAPPLPAPEGPLAEDAPSAKPELPTEEDIDKAFDYVERMMKKLRSRIEKLDPPPEPNSESPNDAKPL